MRRTRKRAVAAAALTLTALTACAGPVTAPGTGSIPVAPAASATPMATPYGDCDQVPVADMADRPPVAALAASPVLSTLSAALGRLPTLSATLDAGTSPLTVLAPSDAAFEALRTRMGQPAYDALLADPERLDGLLSYHVTEKSFDARGLVDAGKTTQLAYGDVTVGGTPDALVLTSTDGTAAGVVCGNVRAVGATVFVIDTVLTPELL